jgi:hypothetical protein
MRGDPAVSVVKSAAVEVEVELRQGWVEENTLFQL